jgi:transposase
MRVAPRITLTEEERRTLEAWASDGASTLRRTARARIILLAAEGKTNLEIAEELVMDRRVVGRWRQRYASHGLPGVEREASRRHRPSPYRERLTRLILETTLTMDPPAGSRWTTRTLAAYLDVSRCRVDRVWRANGIRHGMHTDRFQTVGG